MWAVMSVIDQELSIIHETENWWGLDLDSENGCGHVGLISRHITGTGL